jgi:hypothetical protein
VPDVAFAAKQQLDHLCGAFGGLSEAHHQILVLRELEGLSYREIGERMGMSRPAVESTLFRARRRLTEEYDELASGQRCLRIHSIIAAAGEGRLGARDTRRLARHVAHCQPCRRHAVAAGVDATLLSRRPAARERVAAKVAALFPFPLLLRGRRGGSSSDGLLNQLPLLSDHASAGGTKLAALAALLVAGLGAGVGTQALPGARHDGTAAARPAASKSHSVSAAGRPGAAAVAPAPATRAERSDRATAGSFSRSARATVGSRADRLPGTGKAQTRAGTHAGAGAPAAPGGSDVQTTVSGSTPSTPGTTGPGSRPSLPAVTLPSASVPQSMLDTAATFDTAVGTAEGAAGAVTNTLDSATSGATAPASGVVTGATGTLPTLP